MPDRTLSVKYRFVHVLYQNALYGSLGPSRRASLSAAVAAAMVALHGDQSERLDRAVEQARILRHPLILAFALYFQSWVRQHQRHAAGVLKATADALPLADQYGYPHAGVWTRIMHGWALAHTGRAEEGEAMIRQAIDLLDVLGLKLMWPNFLALLAESLAIQGRVDDALLILAEADSRGTDRRAVLSDRNSSADR